MKLLGQMSPHRDRTSSMHVVKTQSDKQEYQTQAGTYSCYICYKCARRQGSQSLLDRRIE